VVNNGRPPGRLGIEHWSARLLASELGILPCSRPWRLPPLRQGPHHRDRRFIDAYNDRFQQFAWTKHTDEIIAKIRRSKS
jgi:hypothetical protein